MRLVNMVVSFSSYIKLFVDRQTVGGELDLNNYGFVRWECGGREKLTYVRQIIMIDNRTEYRQAG